jgi:hypothetical protein
VGYEHAGNKFQMIEPMVATPIAMAAHLSTETSISFIALSYAAPVTRNHFALIHVVKSAAHLTLTMQTKPGLISKTTPRRFAMSLT